MRTFYLIVLSFALLSCAAKKHTCEGGHVREEMVTITEENPVDSMYNVELFIQQHEPYCGGAAPPDELLNRYSPVTDTFVVINTENQSKIKVRSVDGFIKLQLEPGKYQLFEIFKNVPFHQFYEKISKRPFSNNFQSLGLECYESWWKTPLLEFEVLDFVPLTKLEVYIPVGCFTGKDPCLMYTGPMPP